MSQRSIAIMTGGGDAPGLNAVIRAVVKRGVSVLGWRVIGIRNSLDGLFTDPPGIIELNRDHVRGILRFGGTILGTTNTGNPFQYGPKGARSDRSAEVVDRLRLIGCEGLIAIGGDGTMSICDRLAKEHGLKVVGVPKTIDNDISATEQCFGFDTAMAYATDAVDRLHTTAEAHDRVMVVEVMGRHAGWIALGSGIAGGADAILIPEIPFRLEPVIAKIHRRKAVHRGFSVVVVAEGAMPVGGEAFMEKTFGSGTLKLGGIGCHVAEQIATLTRIETRYTVLGHLLRGGAPTAYDRLLSTRFGSHAIELVDQKRWGRMVAFVGGELSDVPLEQAASGYRAVDPSGDLVETARGMGIVLGDETAEQDLRE
jgi:ATP-dependent phosphofructokinase / diphosphate-dependent phosphofructokinase